MLQPARCLSRIIQSSPRGNRGTVENNGRKRTKLKFLGDIITSFGSGDVRHHHRKWYLWTNLPEQTCLPLRLIDSLKLRTTLSESRGNDRSRRTNRW
mmetsp:Transcript_23236/g.38503  ORF Transcript_23236/g.38503 Transcript_23236/m.38503 type:complete len:97 (+) Transcript_23236:979-1269(+)